MLPKIQINITPTSSKITFIKFKWLFCPSQYKIKQAFPLQSIYNFILRLSAINNVIISSNNKLPCNNPMLNTTRFNNNRLLCLPRLILRKIVIFTASFHRQQLISSTNLSLIWNNLIVNRTTRLFTIRSPCTLEEYIRIWNTD